MSQAAAETIVQFLSFSVNDCHQHFRAMQRFTPRRHANGNEFSSGPTIQV